MTEEFGNEVFLPVFMSMLWLGWTWSLLTWGETARVVQGQVRRRDAQVARYRVTTPSGEPGNMTLRWGEHPGIRYRFGRSHDA